jgi:hypothetical protein
MKVRIPRPSPSMAVGFTALFVALGGTGLAATGALSRGQAKQVKQLISTGTAHNAKNFGGLRPHLYAKASQLGSSKGERFLSAGQTVTLGKIGHFTFTATCSKVDGQNQASFDVTADTTADLDGGGVVPAGTKVNIHTNSDAIDSTPDAPLAPGDFDQVGSASSSTLIAADGREADIFYNDGVNWPAGNGSKAHDCFAGFTGLAG